MMNKNKSDHRLFSCMEYYNCLTNFLYASSLFSCILQLYRFESLLNLSVWDAYMKLITVNNKNLNILCKLSLHSFYHLKLKFKN